MQGDVFEARKKPTRSDQYVNFNLEMEGKIRAYGLTRRREVLLQWESTGHNRVNFTSIFSSCHYRSWIIICSGEDIPTRSQFNYTNVLIMFIMRLTCTCSYDKHIS